MTREDPEPHTGTTTPVPSGADSAGRVVVRPVVPGNLVALDALMVSLDDQARYRRWFTGAADVHRAAAWAAHPEQQDAVGLVATFDGRVVGHAACVPMDDARAKVCFEVAAPWRQHGIAGRLLAELDLQAAQRELTTLVAEVLPENADMLAVLREHGRCVEHRDGGVVELTLAVKRPRVPVTPPPPGYAVTLGARATWSSVYSSSSPRA